MDGIKKIGDFQREFFEVVSGQAKNIFKNWDLKEELKSQTQYPILLSADFAPLVNAIAPLHLASETLENVFKEINDDMRNLFGSRNPEQFANRFGQLLRIDALKSLPDIMKELIQMIVELVLSFGTPFQRLPEARFNLFRVAILEYFFNENGYKTVSGKSIQPPKLFSAFEWTPPTSDDESKSEMDKGIATIKEMVKDLERQVRARREEATAERYIRDLSRICVEVAWDEMYKLKTRYTALQNKPTSVAEKKLVSWFDSFGDLAEASVMPAAETTLSGIGDLQLNPKIVAGLATFCSVTARKATEHAYLQIIGIPL